MPRVCKRWRRLVHSPELLRCIDHYVDGHLASPHYGARYAMVPKAQSFCHWLAARGAGHVQQLSLRVAEEDYITSNNQVYQEDAAEVQEALHIGLAAVASGLRELRLITTLVPFSLDRNNVLALTSLRRLAITIIPDLNHRAATLEVGCPLQQLSGLQELRLDAYVLALSPKRCACRPRSPS